MAVSDWFGLGGGGGGGQGDMLARQTEGFGDFGAQATEGAKKTAGGGGGSWWGSVTDTVSDYAGKVDWGGVGDLVGGAIMGEEQQAKNASTVDRLRAAPGQQAQQFTTSPRDSQTTQRRPVAAGMGGQGVLDFLTSPMGMVMIAGTGLFLLSQAMDD